jgi:hypothetical protein
MIRPAATIPALQPLPRRGLNRVQAALCVGVSATTFDQMVADGRIPKPIRIDDFTVWDVRHLSLVLTGPPWRDVDRPEATKGRTSGTVYVIGYAKIGRTTSVPRRVKELQAGVPGTIEVFKSFLGTLATERNLHKRFAPYRLLGEWSKVDGDLAEFIKAGCPL